MRRLIGPCLLLTALCGLAAAAEKFYFQSFLGEAPPELISADEHWANSDSALTFQKLRGQVVWLQFNF